MKTSNCEICNIEIAYTVKPRTKCKGTIETRSDGTEYYKRSKCELAYIRKWRNNNKDKVIGYLDRAGVSTRKGGSMPRKKCNALFIRDIKQMQSCKDAGESCNRCVERHVCEDDTNWTCGSCGKDATYRYCREKVFG